MAQPLPVEAIASFAHRRSTDVHLVLVVPGWSAGGEEVTVRFAAGGKRRFTQAAAARVEDGATRVELDVPSERLGNRVWALAVSDTGSDAGPHEFQRIQARLLARTTQPVALMVGPRPATRMPAPRPREVSGSTVRRYLGAARRRARNLLPSR